MNVEKMTDDEKKSRSRSNSRIYQRRSSIVKLSEKVKPKSKKSFIQKLKFPSKSPRNWFKTCKSRDMKELYLDMSEIECSDDQDNNTSLEKYQKLKTELNALKKQNNTKGESNQKLTQDLIKSFKVLLDNDVKKDDINFKDIDNIGDEILFHDFIKVRLLNDNIMYYHAKQFCDYYVENELDPLTKNILPHISQLVQLNTFARIHFGEIRKKDVNDEYLNNIIERVSDHLYNQLKTNSQQYFQDIPLISEARCFLDFETLDRCNWVHHLTKSTIYDCNSFLQQQNVIPGSWMIVLIEERGCEDTESNILPHSKLFMILQKVVYKDECKIKKTHFINVEGAGIYNVNRNTNMSSFIMLIKTLGYNQPDFVCIWDLMQTLVSEYFFNIDRLIIDK